MLQRGFLLLRTEADGPVSGEAGDLRQRAVAVVPRPAGGGISEHRVGDETARRRAGNGRHRRGRQRGEHPRAPPAETRLERLPEIGRNAVQLDLGISVMRHAHGFSFLAGPLECAEHRVEEGVIVPGQIDPVRILVEEIAVESERVIVHREPPVQGVQDRIDIDLLLLCIPHPTGIRGEAQALVAQAHPFRREHGPRRSQQQEYSQDEC